VWSSSFSVSPNYIVDTINLSEKTHLTKTITITNLANSTITVDISSSSPKVEVTVTQVEIQPGESAPVTIIISSTEEEVINSKITVSRGSESIEIPVIISVVEPREEKKKVQISIFPSGITASLIQGTARDEIIQIQNVGNEEVDLTATVSGGITLPDGTICPAYIKEFSSGVLKPGEKRTMILGLVGKGVNPGTYTNKILLQYAPGEIIQIPIQLTILSSPTQVENKTMTIVTYPSNLFRVGDVLYISTVDEKGNLVQSTITVEHRDYQGNKIKEFRYTVPFELEPGTYIITARAEGYTQAKKTISIEELNSELVIIPENPTTDDVITIIYQTPEGKLIDNAVIKVGNSTYENSRITVTLDKGEYTIEASAPGYKKRTQTITVRQKIKAIIPKPTIKSGEQEVIEFSANVSYEIKRVEDGEEVTVYYGKGNKYIFGETKPGLYNIYANNEHVGSITVEQAGIDLGVIYEYWWVIAGIVVLVVIYQFSGKYPTPKKKKEEYLIKDVRQVRGALSQEKVEEGEHG